MSWNFFCVDLVPRNYEVIIMRLRFRLRYMFFDVYVVENPKLAHNYKPLRLGFSNNIYEGLNKAARLWNSKAMRYELSITNLTIDILWVDYPFTRLQPVTSCIVDSPAIYVMVVKIENTIWPPPPQISLYRRAALTTNSNHGTQPAQDGKGGAVYIIFSCLCL
jgi:hypothetical protein